MNHIPEQGEIYKHFKGNYYRIVTMATHSETREQLVIYQALYGDGGIYARPLDMFMSPVDHLKYPEVQQKMRFALQSGPVIMQQPEQYIQTTETQTTGQQIDPQVMNYLEADTYEEKLQILNFIHERITNDMLNTMAIAIDVELEEGEVEERYEALKYCLVTKERFECNRLR